MNSACLRFWTAKDSYEQVDYRVKKFLYLFACTNSCANPLIYGVFRKVHLYDVLQEWGNNWGWLRKQDGGGLKIFCGRHLNAETLC